MKKMKAILSVTLCLLMLWACFAPAAASGAAKIPAPTPWYEEGMTDAQKEECKDVMTSLMYGLDELSDYDKCLLLHDRLAARVAYDETADLPETSDSYTAYGALVNRVAVCMGYARAYGWMLAKLGIESSYERSDTLTHGWNKVTLTNDKVYYVDVTNDDPYADVPGRVLHNNVLVSSEEFKKYHLDENDQEVTDYAVLTDTDYDNSFDKNSATEIVKLHGNYYYMKRSSDAENVVQAASLVRRFGPTGAEDTVLTVNTATYTNLTNANASATGTKLYNPKMTAIGDKILYTDGKIVYAFDVRNQQTAPEEVFTLKNTDEILKDLTVAKKNEFLIQGLAQVDGKLYITAFNDEVFDADTVEKYTIELDYCAHETEKNIEEKDSTICTETGYIKYLCADCRRVRLEEKPAAAHDLVCVATVAATCASYESTTWECSNCDYSEVRTGTEFNPNNHPTTEGNRVDVPQIDANCQSAGFSAGVFCNACGKYISGHEPGAAINPDNHANTYVSKEAKRATCLTAGWTEETKCTDCQEVVKVSTPIAALGHDDVITVAAPTCTEDGYTLYRCTRCFREVKEVDEGTATKHPPSQRVEVAKVDPTCCSTGYSAGIYCQACQSYIDGHVLLLKDMNNHVGWMQVNREATCTEDGVSGAEVCIGCGAYKKDADGKEIRGVVLPALGHTWVDEGEIIKKPTCTDTGVAKRTCSVCNKLIATQIEKLGHVDENGDQICDRCSKNLGENACPYCNQIHTGLFAPLTNFFHKILYLIFGPKKVK